MILSDHSIRRPVFATVLSLLLVTFGAVSFTKLQVREFPDIDPPIVTIETNYRGASASVVERRVTQLIEDRISVVEAIHTVESTSEDGRSVVTVEFAVDRAVDSAVNDIRDAVSGLLDELPEEADPPEITKEDAATEVMMWLNLTSDRMKPIELADYAERYLVDRFSVLPGVARVRVSGATRFAMRIWLDREKLAARELTVNDVENALRRENVELPAGAIQSLDRQFTVRLKREYLTEDDFRQLVLKRGDDGYLIRLGEVAEVNLGAEEARRVFRGNRTAMVGMGIIRQSQANTLEVARAAKAEAESIRPALPPGMEIAQSYDTSVFIDASLKEVVKTLLIAILLVVAVIYLFLGNGRATLVPAVTVPVSLVSSFIALNYLGFSVNMLTLLALVLAIGLVVDDAIVVLENVHHRMEEGESAMVAAFRGTRQVGFAVVATTLVLVAVFVPIAFLEGDVGKLFTEFAITMAVAVCFSTLVALTLCPMICSQLLLPAARSNRLTRAMDKLFRKTESFYRRVLGAALKAPELALLLVVVMGGLSYGLFKTLPSEFTPKEDRGAFFVVTKAPEGSSYAFIRDIMEEVEDRLMYLAENGEAIRVLVRAPRGFGNIADFNQGLTIMVLADWGERRSAWAIMDEIKEKLADLPEVQNFVIMRQGLTRGLQKPVQFVIGGPTYEQLAEWRDIMLAKARAWPGLTGIDYDYKETKPQLRVSINRDRAGDLGVSVANIGRTLETFLGSRDVTTFVVEGEEYDVILEGNYAGKQTPGDLQNIYVRSEVTDELIPLSNLVTVEEFADSGILNRFNRLRAITIEANLAEGYSLSQALDFLDRTAAESLPSAAIIDYKGESRDFRESGASVLFIFGLSIVVVFLVLAAQFESFVHPTTIMLTVPVAVAGGFIGLWVSGQTQNIYTQIGMIMLVGLAAKNGILIVEFINQLRDEGVAFDDAILRGSVRRLRPILMTGLTTVMGSLPLILSTGAGSETRHVIGLVILFGVAMAGLLTLIIVPLAYRLFSRRTTGPQATAKKLEAALEAETTDRDKELTAHSSS